MLKWTGVTFALVLTLSGLGCGAAPHGMVPVETPLWSPPVNDPSATEAAEKAEKDSSDTADASGSSNKK